MRMLKWYPLVQAGNTKPVITFSAASVPLEEVIWYHLSKILMEEIFLTIWSCWQVCVSFSTLVHDVYAVVVHSSDSKI